MWSSVFRKHHRNLRTLFLLGALTVFAIVAYKVGWIPVSEEPPNLKAVNVALKRVFPKLTFELPVAMLFEANSRLFVVEQKGRVISFVNNDSVTSKSTFIDISDKVVGPDVYIESGLLGMAFHPDYSTNGQVFLFYTGISETRPKPHTRAVISRFTLDDDGDALDPDSETEILVLELPVFAHHGGTIAFGPDGDLYISLGDVDEQGDPANHSQNVNILFGSILRLDVDGGNPYAIPPDNPFATGGGAPEIYAWGLRNPWKFNFDRETGDLWIGDVGGGGWEEVNLAEKGGNYGWPVMEGFHCFLGRDCVSRGMIDPVVAYPHSEGCSITGGYVYRGSAIADLQGIYLYGDWCSGKIWGVSSSGNYRGLFGIWYVWTLFGGGINRLGPKLFIDSKKPISSFSEDPDGELYVLHHAAGEIYKIVPK